MVASAWRDLEVWGELLYESFRKSGFIEYNGEIRVHNSLLNIFLQE